MSRLLILFVGAFPRRSSRAVLPLFTRDGAVSIGSLGSLLCLPLLQDFLQVESPPVVHKEVLDLAHCLVTDDISNGLEVFTVFPDAWTTLIMDCNINRKQYILKNRKSSL